MFSSPADQVILVLYSLCTGIITELVYELFRFFVSFVFCVSVNSKKKSRIFTVFQFILDILFSLIYTLIAVIFIYGANNGTVRYFILLFAVLGFLICYFTLGKILAYIEKKISYNLYCFIIFLYNTILKLLRPVKTCIISKRIRYYMKKRTSGIIRKGA